LVEQLTLNQLARGEQSEASQPHPKRMKSEQERATGWRGEATQPRSSGEVAESPIQVSKRNKRRKDK